MHGFRLIDQKLNSKGFLRPLVVTHFRSKNFLTAESFLTADSFLTAEGGGVALDGGIIFYGGVVFDGGGAAAAVSVLLLIYRKKGRKYQTSCKYLIIHK